MVDVAALKSSLFVWWRTPLVTVDGVRRETRWGRGLAFDLPPGRHDVRVGVELWGERAAAGTEVRVESGQVTTVYYQAPAIVFSDGVIGTRPPSAVPPGMGLLLAVVCAPLAFVALVVVAVLLAD